MCWLLFVASCWWCIVVVVCVFGSFVCVYVLRVLLFFLVVDIIMPCHRHSTSNGNSNVTDNVTNDFNREGDYDDDDNGDNGKSDDDGGGDGDDGDGGGDDYDDDDDDGGEESGRLQRAHV